MRHIWMSLVAVMTAYAVSPQASADSIYEYRGESYHQFSQSISEVNSLTPLNSLSASFVFDQPLEASLWGVVVVPKAWRIADGTFEVSSEEPGASHYQGGIGQWSALTGLYLTTDEHAEIVGWNFGAVRNLFDQWSTPYASVSLGSNGCLIGCMNSDTSGYRNWGASGMGSSYFVGSWFVSSTVPEPSTWTLVLFGIACICAFRRTCLPDFRARTHKAAGVN